MNLLKTAIDNHPSNDTTIFYTKICSLRLNQGDKLDEFLAQHAEFRDRLITAKTARDARK